MTHDVQGAGGEILDRALAAFLTHRDPSGQSALLLQRGLEVTWLILEPSGGRIALWYGPEAATPAARAEAFRTFVKQHNQQGTPIHFLVSGDADEARSMIEAARPTLMMARLGFYHLDGAGELALRGTRSDWIEAALHRVVDTPPIDDAQLQAALVRTRAVARQEAEVMGKLKGRYAVTAALTAVCVLLFVLRYVWPDGGEMNHLLRMGANFGPRVKDGEVWRLLASAFLHGDVVHLGANMVALWSFGTILEALLGPRRYLVLYGVSALTGALASAFVTEPRVSVGASGAVWGLMTAGIVLVYRPQGLLPERMLAAARARAWTPLALNLMISLRPGIDFLAHIGGGLAGAALFASGAITSGLAPLGAAPVSRRDVRGERPLWTALAVVMLAAMVGSIAAALVTGQPWRAGEPPELVRAEVAESDVTIEIPRDLAAARKVERDEHGVRTTFGAPGNPVVIDVAVQRLEGDIPAENLAAELEDLRGQIQGRTEEGVVRQGAVAVETVGGRRCVVERARVLKVKVDVTAWRCVLGPRLVMVRGFVPEGRPKSWEGVEQKAAASIAVPP